jgi:hypothetical protein
VDHAVILLKTIPSLLIKQTGNSVKTSSKMAHPELIPQPITLSEKPISLSMERIRQIIPTLKEDYTLRAIDALEVVLKKLNLMLLLRKLQDTGLIKQIGPITLSQLKVIMFISSQDGI